MVSTLVGDDPKTGHHETIAKAIERPHSNVREGEQRRVGDEFWGKERVCIFCGLVDGIDEEDIPEADRNSVSFSLMTRQ